MYQGHVVVKFSFRRKSSATLHTLELPSFFRGTGTEATQLSLGRHSDAAHRNYVMRVHDVTAQTRGVRVPPIADVALVTSSVLRHFFPTSMHLQVVSIKKLSSVVKLVTHLTPKTNLKKINKHYFK